VRSPLRPIEARPDEGAAAILGANLTGRRITGQIGISASVLVGVAAMLVGSVSLLWTTATTPYLEVVPQQLLLGAGLGLLVPPITGACSRAWIAPAQALLRAP
jgi:hypothetical protein